MVKAFAWGRSEALWKFRHGVRIKCLPNYLQGSLAVLRSEYLISRANTSIISCNLNVRYCLIRSRHQLLSQARIYISFLSLFSSHLRLALPLYFFLQIWKEVCPENIRSIILYSRPLSLAFCLPALPFPEPCVPIPQVIHLVVCLTTGPKPLPKRALHLVRSRASSFKWKYPLLSLRSSSSFLRLLPLLPVTSIPPFIFPSITCCRRHVPKTSYLTCNKGHVCNISTVLSRLHVVKFDHVMLSFF
jgi:hypothetical protein